MWLQWLRMRIHSKLAGFFLIDNSNNKLLGNYLLCDDPYGSCYPIFSCNGKSPRMPEPEVPKNPKEKPEPKKPEPKKPEPPVPTPEPPVPTPPAPAPTPPAPPAPKHRRIGCLPWLVNGHKLGRQMTMRLGRMSGSPPQKRQSIPTYLEQMATGRSQLRLKALGLLGHRVLTSLSERSLLL